MVGGGVCGVAEIIILIENKVIEIKNIIKK